VGKGALLALLIIAGLGLAGLYYYTQWRSAEDARLMASAERVAQTQKEAAEYQAAGGIAQGAGGLLSSIVKLFW